ncbi:MAG: hypothetical protein LQ352_001167 [Teloschistes flavicans]|nr:MAG: hypothetical protein LQ352_001167 [Teloschistes flavicans]
MDLGNVECFDAPGGAPKEQGCVNTLTLMPCTGDRLRFGRRGLPLAQVPLPQGFRERPPPNTGCSAVVAPKEDQIFLKQWASILLDASTLNAINTPPQHEAHEVSMFTSAGIAQSVLCFPRVPKLLLRNNGIVREVRDPLPPFPESVKRGGFPPSSDSDPHTPDLSRTSKYCLHLNRLPIAPFWFFMYRLLRSKFNHPHNNMDMASHMVSSSRLVDLKKDVRSSIDSLVSRRQVDPGPQSSSTAKATINDSQQQQEDTNDDLRAELDHLRRQYTTEVQETNSKDIQTSRLEEENRSLSCEMSAKTARLTLLEEQNNTLKEENHSLINTNLNLSHQTERLQRKLDKLQHDALVACDYGNNLRSRNNRLIEESGVWKEQNESLQAKNADMEAAAVASAEQIQTLGVQYQDLTVENDTFRNQIDDLYIDFAASAAESNTKIEALTIRNESLESEARGLENLLDEYDALLSNYLAE